jgi:ribose 5-phosphate isomerase RpiB
LAECHQRRAVVLVPDGAVVAAVANRHAKVRAAIVNKPSKLPMLQRCLGPNLLVMETGEVAVRQIQALVADFFKGRPQTEECVAAALEAVCDENGPRQCFCRL